MRKTLTLLVLLAAVVAAGPAAAQADFSKVVSVGASWDAGFLDGCLVKHGQLDSWPAIFARQAKVSGFEQPIVNEPGLGPCMVLTSLPPMGPTFSYKPNTGTPANATLARPYDNLAIPSYLAASVVNCKTNVTDPTNPLYAACANQLIDLVLRNPNQGNTTALQQAASLKPTFAMVGVLGNELLRPALAGTVIDGVTLMPKAAYAASYKTIVDTLKASQPSGGKGIVFGLGDPTFLAYLTAVSPVLGVNPATGEAIRVLGPTGCPTGVPFCPVPAGTIVPLPLGALMKTGYGVPCAVAPLPNCNKPLPDNYTAATGIPGLLYPSEVALLQSRGAEYSADIKALAEADGFKYFDAFAVIRDMIANGKTYGGFTVTLGYLSGGFFGYDGYHPNAIGYAILADEVIKFVNAQYGTDVARVDMYPYLFNGNSQAGGFPVGAQPTQDEIIEWAAAYFTDGVLEQMRQTFPIPAISPEIVVGDGDDDPVTGARGAGGRTPINSQ